MAPKAVSPRGPLGDTLSSLGMLPRGERTYLALTRSLLPKLVLLVLASMFVVNTFFPAFNAGAGSQKDPVVTLHGSTSAGRRRITGASVNERGLSNLEKPQRCHGWIVPTVSVMGKTAVALAFKADEVEAAMKALENYNQQAPCTDELDVKERAVLLVYGNLDIRPSTDAGKMLREKVATLPSLKKCFAQVQYVSANLIDDPNHQARQAHKWMRGQSMMFYNMVFFELHTGRLMSLGIEHLLWLEPSSEVMKEGWLDSIMLEAAKSKGNYWVQGTVFRGKCMPKDDGKCYAVRKDRVGVVRRPALWNAGSADLMQLLREVTAGPYMDYPFEEATFLHMTKTWSDYRLRSSMHLYQRVDWARDYGRYWFDKGSLSEDVLILHHEEPMIHGEVPDSEVASPQVIEEGSDGVASDESQL